MRIIIFLLASITLFSCHDADKENKALHDKMLQGLHFNTDTGSVKGIPIFYPHEVHPVVDSIAKAEGIRVSWAGDTVYVLSLEIAAHMDSCVGKSMENKFYNLRIEGDTSTSGGSRGGGAVFSLPKHRLIQIYPPQDGTLEYDGTYLYQYKKGKRQKLSKQKRDSIINLGRVKEV